MFNLVKYDFDDRCVGLSHEVTQILPLKKDNGEPFFSFEEWIDALRTSTSCTSVLAALFHEKESLSEEEVLSRLDLALAPVFDKMFGKNEISSGVDNKVEEG